MAKRHAVWLAVKLQQLQAVLMQGTASSALYGSRDVVFGPIRSDILESQSMRVFGNRALQWPTSVTFVEGEMKPCVLCTHCAHFDD